MADYTVHSFKQLSSLVKKLLKKDERAVKRAMRASAKFGAKQIAILAPVAFEELKDSIHVVDTTIIVDAPHAAAVEMGSRPHCPPLEPLIKWVKLMGAKGLTPKGNVKRVPKVTYGSLPFETGQRRQDFHARTTARAIKRFRAGKGALSVDAPEYVARAIQKAIMIGGTKPTFFVQNSLIAIENFLMDAIREEMSKT